MVGTVTLGIDRYNALYKRALQADALEKENAELRERLSNATDVSYEVVDGSELVCSVYADEIKVDEKCVDVFSKAKEEECSEEDEKDVVTINGKSVKDLSAENEMLHKMGVFKHYAKGGVTTKEEVTELKRSKKNK